MTNSYQTAKTAIINKSKSDTSQSYWLIWHADTRKYAICTEADFSTWLANAEYDLLGEYYGGILNTAYINA